VTSDPEEILSAPRVILPGVGAFAVGMAELGRDGLDDVTRKVAQMGTPLLGICLGMQMLFDESEEFGTTTGLGLIGGRVIPIPAVTADGGTQKIPHIGWNALVHADGAEQWKGTLLDEMSEGDEMYFVHSMMAMPIDAHHRLADCSYGGISVSAVVKRENVMGCQFHPEKSGERGLRILKSFLGPVTR
jgi:imidazole glycerol-phosphate synthase subunit HisH